MTEEERQLLEAAAQYGAALAEMMERTLLATQRLCAEIKSGSPNAIETAKDIEKRLGNIFQAWLQLGGIQKLNS